MLISLLIGCEVVGTGTIIGTRESDLVSIKRVSAMKESMIGLTVSSIGVDVFCKSGVVSIFGVISCLISIVGFV
ncbi:MAG: hypothetical protein U0L38_01895 [Bacteroidales bacterium]|nr:hypothetical protein [Bacteroidales bacterium]